MKVLLTVGCLHSGHDQVFDLLVQAGVDTARNSRSTGYSPQALQELLLRAHELDLREGIAPVQVHPGKFWNELAADLFVSNINRSVWGWADHQTSVLMDFWLDFDPQVRVLMVYNSPEAYLERVLRHNTQPSQHAVEMALEQWLLWNTALLRHFYRNAGRCALINSDQALEQPSALIGQVASQWQIDELQPNLEPNHSSEWYRDLSGHLVRQMIDTTHPVWALMQEMDGVALLPAVASSGNETSPVHGAHLAWSDWLQVRAALAIEARDKAEAVAQRDALAQEKAKLIEAHAELTRASAELTAQRDSEARAKAEAVAQRDALAQEKAKLIEAHADLMRANTELTAQRESLEQRVATQIEITKKLEKKNDESILNCEQENELLLQQLHQVQEELEHYFLKSRQLEEQHQAEANSFEALFWRMHPPEGVRIDMRLYLTGTNWYEPEADGRWAGPNALSTLQLPPMPSGDYAIELDVVDAMHPDIVSELCIEVLGQSLPVQVDWPIADHFYPVTCKASLTISDNPTSEPWTIGLRFARLLSPADSGAEDKRILAIRLRALRLLRLT